MKRKDFVIAGLGGQGVLTMAQVLALAGLKQGWRVKLFEGTGLTQRGGGVFSFVRFGEAFSPRIPLGQADVLISLEPSELLTVLPYLRPQGAVWMNSEKVHGYYSKLSPDLYPSEEKLKAVIRMRTNQLFVVPGGELAREAGAPQAANMVMLGAFLAQSELVATDFVIQAIETLNKRFAPSNLEAFWKGYGFMKKEKAA